MRAVADTREEHNHISNSDLQLLPFFMAPTVGPTGLIVTSLTVVAGHLASKSFDFFISHDYTDLRMGCLWLREAGCILDYQSDSVSFSLQYITDPIYPRTLLVIPTLRRNDSIPALPTTHAGNTLVARITPLPSAQQLEHQRQPPLLAMRRPVSPIGNIPQGARAIRGRHYRPASMAPQPSMSRATMHQRSQRAGPLRQIPALPRPLRDNAPTPLLPVLERLAPPSQPGPQETNRTDIVQTQELNMQSHTASLSPVVILQTQEADVQSHVTSILPVPHPTATTTVSRSTDSLAINIHAATTRVQRLRIAANFSSQTTSHDVQGPVPDENKVNIAGN